MSFSCSGNLITFIPTISLSRSEVAAYKRDRACMCIMIIKTSIIMCLWSKHKNKGLHIQIIDTGEVTSLAAQYKNYLCHYKSKSLGN